jgi:hypothetical protein
VSGGRLTALQRRILGVPIAVDTAHEILAGKLATLLERSEPRDLVDVKALLDAGGNLEAALRDAPKKDAGFSPLTLAWVLKSVELSPAARVLGWAENDLQALMVFRQWLLDRLTTLAAPE